MATQQLVKMGARRRIGSGSSVKIFRDPWLNDPLNPYIESSPTEGFESAIVDSLRSVDSGEWDMDILSDLFNSRDIEVILYVPLSHAQVEDFSMWSGEQKGNYFVRSGCRLLCSCVDPHCDCLELRITALDHS